MSDIFTEARKLELAKTTQQRMVQASQQLAAFNQTILDVYANWSGYVALETDDAKLEAARAAFSTESRGLIDERKAGLATSFDIIGGGTRGAEGNPLTRQNLLDEVAAVQ